MDKEKHIKRGRAQMRIRLKGKSKGDESVHDLLKLPIEVLYTEALREIGEQEAYIDELQSTIKSLEVENKCLRVNVNSLSAQIIQRPTLFTIRIFGFSVQIYDAKVRRFIAMLYIFLQTAVLSTKWQYKKNPHRNKTMGIGVI